MYSISDVINSFIRALPVTLRHGPLPLIFAPKTMGLEEFRRKVFEYPEIV